LALCVSANTNRQVHQPTRNEATNPVIGIAIVSTYARNFAGTLHVHTLIVVRARGHLRRLHLPPLISSLNGGNRSGWGFGGSSLGSPACRLFSGSTVRAPNDPKWR
jgi:hypothetical protein